MMFWSWIGSSAGGSCHKKYKENNALYKRYITEFEILLRGKKAFLLFIWDVGNFFILLKIVSPELHFSLATFLSASLFVDIPTENSNWKLLEL